MKTGECTNSADPDEAAHNESPHQDLNCLPFFLDSHYDIFWAKLFFLNFADVNFVVCIFWCFNAANKPTFFSFKITLKQQ